MDAPIGWRQWTHYLGIPISIPDQQLIYIWPRLNSNRNTVWKNGARKEGLAPRLAFLRRCIARSQILVFWQESFAFVRGYPVNSGCGRIDVSGDRLPSAYLVVAPARCATQQRQPADGKPGHLISYFWRAAFMRLGHIPSLLGEGRWPAPGFCVDGRAGGVPGDDG